MKNNPLLDARHKKEYLIFGSIAAIVYMIPVMIFLGKHNFQSLYYLFMGCFFFMAAIFFYCFKLLYTRYDEKRAVSILLAGHLATATGVVLACILVMVAIMLYNIDIFGSTLHGEILPGSPAQSDSNEPSHLLLMILTTTVIGNVGTGSFISIIVSYANKRDQTKDKPVEIGPQSVDPV
jgi:hypothetical protein